MQSLINFWIGVHNIQTYYLKQNKDKIEFRQICLNFNSSLTFENIEELQLVFQEMIKKKIITFESVFQDFKIDPNCKDKYEAAKEKEECLRTAIYTQHVDKFHF